MPDSEQRFALSMREVDTDEPGLVREVDGTVWLVNPGGTRTQLGVTSPQPGQEIDYEQIVIAASVTDTSEATGTALITSNAVEYDGEPVIVEFFCAVVQSPSNAAGDSVRVSLWEGASQLTRLGYVKTTTAGQAGRGTVLAHYRFTPAAGTHQFKIAASANTTVGSPTLFAGPGGALKDPPAYIRVSKV